MRRRTHRQKGRLLLTGTILLLLLATGVIITGQIINRMAAQMSERVITQFGEYHYRILEVEFRHSQNILATAASFIREHPAPTQTELEVLTSTLMQTDHKVGRIWFMQTRSRTTLDFPRGAVPSHSSAESDFRAVLTRDLLPDSIRSHVVSTNERKLWSLVCRITSSDGSDHICGVDFPLPEMFSYLTIKQDPFSRSYATLVDPNGITVFHPDSLRLGHPALDSAGRSALHQVITSGERVITRSVSEYLHIEEERIYYPITIGGHRWVVGIGIPQLIIEQEIDDFHFYTLLIAGISVLFFSVMLFLAQRRWRREYELRRQSERESEQLQLQQVLEQIDPHFLFNSLNSLYALIPRNPEQAREFTLSLSRVYRRVLERRKEILATLSDEIDFTWQYYTLQKIRFDNRIELTTVVDPALRHHRIPAMSLQTLVENAVKHNRITAQNPLHIRIRTEEGGLVIENNYTPREDQDSNSLGVGLERIRSVYRFYTDENITISISEGTFYCRLPLLPPEK